eukprot:6492189-Amphidinium_carterae.1
MHLDIAQSCSPQNFFIYEPIKADLQRLKNASTKAHACSLCVVAAAVKQGPYAAVMDLFLSRSASILIKGPVMTQHLADMRDPAIAPELVPKLMQIATDIPCLRQSLMPSTVEPLEVQFTGLVLELAKASENWQGYDYGELMKLLSEASTLLTSSSITTAMYSLGEKIKKRNGEKAKTTMLGLAQAVVDDVEDNNEQSSFTSRAKALREHLVTHATNRDADSTCTLKAALKKLLDHMSDLFCKSEGLDGDLEALKDAAQEVAKGVAPNQMSVTLDLLGKGMELKRSSDTLHEKLASVLKSGTDVQDLLVDCISVKRSSQQVRAYKTKSSELNTDLAQGLDKVESDAEKTYTCCREQILKVTEKDLTTTHQQLLVVAGGWTNQDVWLKDFKGETFAALVDHAKQTLLMTESAGLVSKTTECAEVRVRTSFKTCIPSCSCKECCLWVSNLPMITCKTNYDNNVFIKTKSVAPKALQKHIDTSDALLLPMASMHLKSVTETLAKARLTKCTHLCLEAFVLFEIEQKPQNLRSAVQTELKELRQFDLSEQMLDPILKDYVKLAMALRYKGMSVSK